jgi:Domain of unknown function (DUF6457)
MQKMSELQADEGRTEVGVGGLRWRRLVVCWGAEGVRGVADLGAWLGAVATELGVPVEEVLSESVQDEMLALTGEIAHNVVRVAVPLSSYLMGVAVGRGVSPEEALRIVSGLLPGHDE